MKEIARADLKHNFLKQIILRLDYQGVLENELDGIISECKLALKEYEFNRFTENQNSEYDVNVSTAGSNLEPHIRKKGNRKVYSFLNEAQGHQLDITKDFIAIKINSTRYCPFESYSDYLFKIYCILNSKIDFITYQRLGLRKINECVVFDKNSINRFFSKGYFSYFSELQTENNIASKYYDFFVFEKYKVNLMRGIHSGRFADKDAYIIQLDTDVYVDTENLIMDSLAATNKMNDLNELSFKLYQKSLTEELLNMLSVDDFDSDEICGVESNE